MNNGRACGCRVEQCTDSRSGLLDLKLYKQHLCYDCLTGLLAELAHSWTSNVFYESKLRVSNNQHAVI